MQDKSEGEVPARAKALESLGVTIGHDYEYRGKVGKGRYKVDQLNTVNGVYLPLTPLEWCLMCMREPPDHPDGGQYESFYVGPCCGITGQMQDIINNVFRDGGWADGHDLLELGELARTHPDGFEDFFPEMTDEVFDGWVKRWKDGELHDPWAKIGIVFNAVEPWLQQVSYMVPTAKQVPSEYRTEEQEVIHVLQGTLSRMSWTDMFNRDSEEELAQHKANRVTLQARMYPMVTRLHELLDEEGIDFHGYGIALKGTDDIMSNVRGLCLYPEREMAERLLELWKRQETTESARSKHSQDDVAHVPQYVEPPAEIVHVIVDKTGVHVART